MSGFDEVLASSEWAFAFAESLGEQLADDRILTVGEPLESAADVLADGGARAVAVRFTTGSGEAGTITLIAGAAFVTALERAAPDELLTTSCVSALASALRSIGEQAGIEIDQETPSEIEIALLAEAEAGERVIYPLLDGGELLGAVIFLVSASAGADATPGAPATGSASDPDVTGSSSADPTGASYVLADVEMGVTAELGRCRMTVRELLSITPGAVIDLDRPAGAPVDVLVNGTLIARGEVVVIDEEFGIRISELIPQPAAARSL